MKSIDFLKNNGVDLNKCLELFGDVETYNETLKGFNKSVDGKLAQIDNFLNEGDMPNYAIFVHSLKSDCKYFGFMKLANIAFEHEMASKNNDTKFVKEHYQTLLDETEKVKQLVNEYLYEGNEVQEPPAPEILSEPVKVENNISGIIVEDNNTPRIEVLEEHDPVEINTITADTLANLEVLSEDIILVADDSEVVRIFVEKIFDDKYEIARACNGLEALNIIKEHEQDNKIKAILLDLNMPKLDGFAVLDYMEESDLLKKMPVTIISGDSSKTAISKAFKYEIVDMINKPFSEQKIKEAVEKTMNYHV